MITPMQRLARPLLTTVLVLLLTSMAPAVPRAQKAAAGTNGAYKGVFRGGLQGKATAVVTPVAVTIIGNIEDTKTGKKGTFVTASLSLQDGRFSGIALAGLATVNIAGRVEPADGKLIKTQRVFCTLTDGKNASRFFATK